MTDPKPRDLGLVRFLEDDGAPIPDAVHDVPDAVCVRAYEEMRRLRALDARMVVLQRQGRVGFYGACTGQEAVPIATGLALSPADWVYPALREQSVMLVRGFPLVPFIAQVFGSSGDVQKGRQMPSHHSARAVNQVSWSSCIGPQVPQAVGTAMAMKLAAKGAKPAVSIGFLGDGATSQPDFHAAMTLAARFRPPCVLVCQNNHWSISVPTAKQTASETIAIKGRAYGIPSVRVDGNDFVAVFHVVREAVDNARRGGGPTFIEALTYRIGAHSTSDDPTRYRSDAEVEAWKRKDPVLRLRKYLTTRGLASEERDAAIDAAATREIAAAVDEVETTPPPARDTLFQDVYAIPPWNLVEQAGNPT